MMKSSTSMMIPKLTKERDKEYLRRVAGMNCMVGELSEGQEHHAGVAHHLMCSGEHGMATKSGDDWAVPLCPRHHRELHDFPDGEKAWFEMYGWSWEAVLKYRQRLWDGRRA